MNANRAALPAIVLAASAAVAQGQAPAPSKAVFQNGATSTEWVDFALYGGTRIFIPAKINGRSTMAWLVSAPIERIDTAFATSAGVHLTPGATSAESVTVQVQFGDLTMREVKTAALDFAGGGKRPQGSARALPDQAGRHHGGGIRRAG